MVKSKYLYHEYEGEKDETGENLRIIKGYVIGGEN